MSLIRPMASTAIALACLGLTGCNAFLSEGTADLAGIGGGAIAGALTENAVAASGIGLAVRSLAAAGLDYAERRVQNIEQLAIAEAAGGIDVGDIAPWDVGLTPVASSGHGRVSVAREFVFGETPCKEIVFSVDDEELASSFFVAHVCQSENIWHWASAEPATARWGSLQ